MTWSPPGDLLIREARLDDAVPLGSLLLEALDEAPSSPVGLADIGQDPLLVGGELVEGGSSPGAVTLIADTPDGVAGVGQLTPRQLFRARHIADLRILVHPEVRRQGIGGALGQALVRRAVAAQGLRKLAGRVAEDDDGLRATLARCGDWRRERVERLALFRDGKLYHCEVWGLRLPLHASR